MLLVRKFVVLLDPSPLICGRHIWMATKVLTSDTGTFIVFATHLIRLGARVWLSGSTNNS